MSSEEQKTIVRRLFEEVLNEGRLAAIDELVAPDYLSHAGAPRREDFQQAVTRLRAGFPDLRYTIEEMIAEGDKVVIRVTMQGTHGGEYLGIPATGKRVTSESIHIVRLASGKIREHWAHGANLRHQLDSPLRPRSTRSLLKSEVDPSNQAHFFWWSAQKVGTYATLLKAGKTLPLGAC